MSAAQLPATARPLTASAGLAVVLIVVADGLFWTATPGLSCVLFAALLLAVVAARSAVVKRPVPAAAFFVASALPMLEAASLLAGVFLIAGTTAAALMLADRVPRGWSLRVLSGLHLLFGGPETLTRDARQLAATGLPRADLRALAMGWALPVGFGLLFLALFAAANPVIDGTLTGVLDTLVSLDADPARLLFWAGVLVLVWPFLRLAALRLPSRDPARDWQPTLGPLAALLSEPAMRRALIVGNALFALETLLDLAYLTGGRALPEGMTYAGYAHRGAYPLLGAAVLAGGFVLLANRGGGASPGLRLLLQLWLGQTVLLLCSALFRLDLYVSWYGLTGLRFWAGAGMVLLAIVLGLAALSIRRGHSNARIAGQTAGLTATALYLMACLNTTALIADFNTAHAREVGGTGLPLDVTYICAQGRHAVRAADWFAAQPGGRVLPCLAPPGDTRAGWRPAPPPAAADWRSWGFRDWRLSRYLATRKAPE